MSFQATDDSDNLLGLFDPAEVGRALELIIPPGQTCELRALNAIVGDDRWPQVYFGYFDRPEKLVTELAKIKSATGIYITPNPANDALLARSANRFRRAAKGNSTSDHDVTARHWLLIDFDAKRPAGISSSDSEHMAAIERAQIVREYLSKLGWPEPIFADSGNGAHLIYRIDLPVDDGGLVERCLAALSEQFSDAIVGIDTAVFNPARIWKLYGTRACKGDSTAERPHRMARILDATAPIQIVGRFQLESLAGGCRGESAPRNNGHVAPGVNGKAFDMAAFIDRHSFDVAGPSNWKSGGQMWEFITSPMCEHHDRAAFIGQQPNGPIVAGCHHDSCSWSWPNLRAKYEPRPGGGREQDGNTKECGAAAASSNELPEIKLPPGEQNITDLGARLGELLAAHRTHFSRGGVPTRRDSSGTLHPVSAAALVSDFERVARFTRRTKNSDGWFTKPAVCPENLAKLIMHSQSFNEALPPLKVVSRCPVLVERGGGLIVLSGYDQRSGVLSEGLSPDELSHEEAHSALYELLRDFRFASLSDKSRAFSALITPALIMGNLLPGRAPFDLSEADQSQTGKGYRNKTTAAVYNQVPTTVTQRRTGVGGLEESFDAALIAGNTFISLDNIRGKVDSPALESFMTEDTYLARSSYSRQTPIDPRRVTVMFTSNRAAVTDDLAKRSSCVRLLKQPSGYEFPTYPEGDFLAHVRANQPYYLGAVFTIIRLWYEEGRRRTGETRHDFRDWAQVLDWIVQNLLDAAPLLDGHRETQQRMTNPAMNWLRDVALAVVRLGRTGNWLLASDLLDLIDADGSVEIPGLNDGDVEDEAARKSALKQIGRRMKNAFGGRDAVTIDHLRIERESYQDESQRERNRYRVTEVVGEDSSLNTSNVEP